MSCLDMLRLSDESFQFIYAREPFKIMKRERKVLESFIKNLMF